MRPLLAVGLKLSSFVLFTAMITLVKLMPDRVPAGQIVFARSFVAIVPVLIMVIWRGELDIALRTSRIGGHLMRAVVGISAMGLWFAALRLMPLPDATAISYATPLLTVALAAVFLHERVRAFRWAAVVVGLIGVLVILWPHLGGSGSWTGDKATGATLALTSAALMAVTMILVRKLITSERTATVVTYFCIIASILSLMTAPFGWVVPTTQEAVSLVAIGLIGGVGQILMTLSYRYADASTLAPFDYSTMIFAVIVGFFVFGERPDGYVLAGAAVVISAGLFVIYREHRLGLDRTRARRALTPSRA